MIIFQADESPVTLIDQLIERELKKLITSKYPNDGILGEETGTDKGTCDNLWFIDPIDGINIDWEGNKLDMHSDGKNVSAATPELHESLLELLNS